MCNYCGDHLMMRCIPRLFRGGMYNISSSALERCNPIVIIYDNVINYVVVVLLVSCCLMF